MEDKKIKNYENHLKNLSVEMLAESLILIVNTSKMNRINEGEDKGRILDENKKIENSAEIVNYLQKLESIPESILNHISNKKYYFKSQLQKLTKTIEKIIKILIQNLKKYPEIFTESDLPKIISSLLFLLFIMKSTRLYFLFLDLILHQYELLSKVEIFSIPNELKCSSINQLPLFSIMGTLPIHTDILSMDLEGKQIDLSQQAPSIQIIDNFLYLETGICLFKYPLTRNVDELTCCDSDSSKMQIIRSPNNTILSVDKDTNLIGSLIIDSLKVSPLFQLPNGKERIADDIQCDQNLVDLKTKLSDFSLAYRSYLPSPNLKTLVLVCVYAGILKNESDSTVKFVTLKHYTQSQDSSYNLKQETLLVDSTCKDKKDGSLWFDNTERGLIVQHIKIDENSEKNYPIFYAYSSQNIYFIHTEKSVVVSKQKIFTYELTLNMNKCQFAGFNFEKKIAYFLSLDEHERYSLMQFKVQFLFDRIFKEWTSANMDQEIALNSQNDKVSQESENISKGIKQIKRLPFSAQIKVLNQEDSDDQSSEDEDILEIVCPNYKISYKINKETSSITESKKTKNLFIDLIFDRLVDFMMKSTFSRMGMYEKIKDMDTDFYIEILKVPNTIDNKTHYYHVIYRILEYLNSLEEKSEKFDCSMHNKMLVLALSSLQLHLRAVMVLYNDQRSEGYILGAKMARSLMIQIKKINIENFKSIISLEELSESLEEIIEEITMKLDKIYQPSTTEDPKIEENIEIPLKAISFNNHDELSIIDCIYSKIDPATSSEIAKVFVNEEMRIFKGILLENLGLQTLDFDHKMMMQQNLVTFIQSEIYKAMNLKDTKDFPDYFTSLIRTVLQETTKTFNLINQTFFMIAQNLKTEKILKKVIYKFDSFFKSSLTGTILVSLLSFLEYSKSEFINEHTEAMMREAYASIVQFINSFEDALISLQDRKQVHTSDETFQAEVKSGKVDVQEIQIPDEMAVKINIDSNVQPLKKHGFVLLFGVKKGFPENDPKSCVYMTSLNYEMQMLVIYHSDCSLYSKFKVVSFTSAENEEYSLTFKFSFVENCITRHISFVNMAATSLVKVGEMINKNLVSFKNKLISGLTIEQYDMMNVALSSPAFANGDSRYDFMDNDYQIFNMDGMTSLTVAKEYKQNILMSIGMYGGQEISSFDSFCRQLEEESPEDIITLIPIDELSLVAKSCMFICLLKHSGQAEVVTAAAQFGGLVVNPDFLSAWTECRGISKIVAQIQELPFKIAQFMRKIKYYMSLASSGGFGFGDEDLGGMNEQPVILRDVQSEEQTLALDTLNGIIRQSTKPKITKAKALLSLLECPLTIEALFAKIDLKQSIFETTNSGFTFMTTISKNQTESCLRDEISKTFARIFRDIPSEISSLTIDLSGIPSYMSGFQKPLIDEIIRQQVSNLCSKHCQVSSASLIIHSLTWLYGAQDLTLVNRIDMQRIWTSIQSKDNNVVPKKCLLELMEIMNCYLINLSKNRTEKSDPTIIVNQLSSNADIIFNEMQRILLEIAKVDKFIKVNEFESFVNSRNFDSRLKDAISSILHHSPGNKYQVYDFCYPSNDTKIDISQYQEKDQLWEIAYIADQGASYTSSECHEMGNMSEESSSEENNDTPDQVEATVLQGEEANNDNLNQVQEEEDDEDDNSMFGDLNNLFASNPNYDDPQNQNAKPKIKDNLLFKPSIGNHSFDIDKNSIENYADLLNKINENKDLSFNKDISMKRLLNTLYSMVMFGDELVNTLIVNDPKKLQILIEIAILDQNVFDQIIVKNIIQKVFQSSQITKETLKKSDIFRTFKGRLMVAVQIPKLEKYSEYLMSIIDLMLEGNQALIETAMEIISDVFQYLTKEERARSVRLLFQKKVNTDIVEGKRVRVRSPHLYSGKDALNDYVVIARPQRGYYDSRYSNCKRGGFFKEAYSYDQNKICCMMINNREGKDYKDIVRFFFREELQVVINPYKDSGESLLTNLEPYLNFEVEKDPQNEKTSILCQEQTSLACNLLQYLANLRKSDIITTIVVRVQQYLESMKASQNKNQSNKVNSKAKKLKGIGFKKRTKKVDKEANTKI